MWATPPVWLGLSGRNSGKFLKDPGNALRAFPAIPLDSTAGIPQALQFKAFEGSRAFPELSPAQYGWGRFFFQKWFWRGPLRAGHGIPSSTGSISENVYISCVSQTRKLFGPVNPGTASRLSQGHLDVNQSKKFMFMCLFSPGC